MPVSSPLHQQAPQKLSQEELNQRLAEQLQQSCIQDRSVALIGYGNQGRPQAQNLKDSGVSVCVGVRHMDSASAQCAKADGLAIVPISLAVEQNDILMLLLPDEAIGPFYETHLSGLEDVLAEKFIGLAHGLSLQAGWMQPKPHHNVFLVSPKAQGRGVREKYLQGGGVPCLVAVHQDPSQKTWSVALAYAIALGCHHTGVYSTTIREETECDLFSEQTVLCGGLTALIRTAFETLTEAGYSPEVAAFECLYEVKLLADLLHERGITGMREAISPAARFGDVTRGPRLIDERVRQNMRQILAEIQSGQFARELKTDAENGYPTLHQAVANGASHPLEKTYGALLAQWSP
ncbi:MAG: ketol-acid reductoisomerase [Candidatus Melainabacteria bacterium]|nr:ketol-acid reductoisomerase [Candidatus Melainabacteria bacterium]